MTVRPSGASRRPSHLRRGLFLWPASAALLGASTQAQAQAGNRAAGEVLVGGTGAGLGPLQKALGGAAKLRFVPNLGTGGGIKAVTAGAIDMALSARAASQAERAQGLVSRELFRTPYVFAVHADAPVQRLALADLVPLYAGRTPAWPNGAPVRLVLRPGSDSDTHFVKGIHPAMADAVAAAHARAGAHVAATDGDALEALARIEGSLGITTLGLLRAEGQRVKPLALDGVTADAASLADGRYPHAKTVHLITRGEPTGELGAALRALTAKPVVQALQAMGCLMTVAAA